MEDVRKTWSVDIVSRKDKEVCRSIPAWDWRDAEKIEAGVRINLDHKNYTTRIVRNREVTNNGNG